MKRTDKRINKLEDKTMESIESVKQKEKRLETEKMEPKRPVGHHRESNICLVKVPEGAERKK